MIIENC